MTEVTLIDMVQTFLIALTFISLSAFKEHKARMISDLNNLKKETKNSLEKLEEESKKSLKKLEEETKNTLKKLEEEIDRRLNLIEETLEDCDEKDKGRVTSVIRALMDVKDRLHVVENDPDRKLVREFIDACYKEVEDILNEYRKIIKNK